ncbi:MAG: Rpn family recombination-promoting nuclease/putative transposase [Arcicella sp.]|jgi:predicted transposase/invertase (TIGR01784 family)|nr:Rpn family recombination-promoting nuclease/putative transposase [Arcicella sp.]
MSKKKPTKESQNITNVHDKFFKETFSRLEVVQNFIEETLPVEYKSKINLQNLVLSKDSFIDTSLEEHLADLVYKTTFEGQEVLITLLFEHKSYIDSFPHWQLLRYMTNVWELEQKQKQKPSLVISIIIHHGDSTWKKVPIQSYFGQLQASLLPFLPEFDYILVSLNDFSDKQITEFKNAFLRTAALLMKHSRDEEKKLLAIESIIVDCLKSVEALQDDDYMETVILYMNNTLDLTTNELMIIFTKVSTIVTQKFMTVDQRIRIEATENVTLQYIKGMLEEGFNADTIAKVFKLPIKKVQDIIQKIKDSNPNL